MSGEEEKIKARCPVCEARYRVPAAAIGHRAHCPRCDSTFRVAKIKPRSIHRPTEDDILRWLNEGMDEEVLAPRPRIVSGGPEGPPVPVNGTAKAVPVSPDDENEERPSPASFRAKLSSPGSPLPDPELTFRKTG